jgi:hypothetical protein
MLCRRRGAAGVGDCGFACPVEQVRKLVVSQGESLRPAQWGNSGFSLSKLVVYEDLDRKMRRRGAGTRQLKHSMNDARHGSPASACGLFV